MEKVKFILTIVSVAIIVVPMVVELYAYSSNPLGLIIPPQLQDLMSGQGSNNLSGSGGLLPQNSQSGQSQSLPNFQMPKPAGQVQYNPTTGDFSVPFNFTNPLSAPLSVEQFSAQVVGANNAVLGNVSIAPVNVGAGANAIVTAAGSLNQSAVNTLESEYQNGNLDVSLRNVNLNVGGVTVHIDQTSDIGQILSSAGLPNIPIPSK